MAIVFGISLVIGMVILIMIAGWAMTREGYEGF